MKSRKNLSFLMFCCVLVVGLVWAYGSFKSYFEAGVENDFRAKTAEHQAWSQQEEVLRLKNQIKDLQFQTAIALQDSSKENAVKKELLSTTRIPASDTGIDFAEMEFQKAKLKFEAQDWRKSTDAFENFTDKYPLSPRVIEAYFFLGEGYFKQGKYKDMLEIVDFMASQFPESELTGFLLLRQSQLAVMHHQLDEAREIFALIRQQYKNQALLEQVSILEQGLEL